MRDRRGDCLRYAVLNLNETNSEMALELDASISARNAALVTCNAVELNMEMIQLIVLTLHSIGRAHLSPSANQLKIKNGTNI